MSISILYMSFCNFVNMGDFGSTAYPCFFNMQNIRNPGCWFLAVSRPVARNIFMYRHLTAKNHSQVRCCLILPDMLQYLRYLLH